MIARAQIPNLLTFARIAAVPACLVLMLVYPAQHVLLFVVFVAASLTDFLDGYLARKWQVTSALGALLDPIADKLLVALMLLYALLFFNLSLLIVAIIILRELYIAGLREFLAIRQIGLPVSRGGKLKTAVQMLGIGLLLAAPATGVLALVMVGKLLLSAAAALALTSAWQYTRASLPHLR